MFSKYFGKIITFLLACTILSGSLPLKCFALTNDGVDNSKIDEYVMTQMKQTHIPGLSIGIIKGDKILYLKGYGNADKGRSVTAQTPFEIGSVSKSFTALAVMQLVDKGLIDLNSPVQKYLPWFKAYYHDKSAVVTVRQLLNQNGGIPAFHDGDAKESDSIEKVVKEKLNNLNLLIKPGTEFLYSNANYIILGEIVQTVSGQSYKEYIKNNIFIPLEMKHSYLSKEDAAKNGLATGYRTWFGFTVKSDLPYFEGNIPCGHIISCAEDMCNYLSIFMNDGKYKNTSIISLEGMKTLLAPAVKTLVPMGTEATEVKYAMGWGVNYLNGKVDAIEHTGETANYHAHAIFKPEEKIGVIEMDNEGGYITAGQIAPGVLKIALNEPPADSMNLGIVMMIFNAIYIVIAIILVIALLRLRTFKQRILKSKAKLAFHMVFILPINIILPLFLAIGTPDMFGASWKASIFYSPDISIFIISVIIVLFIIGIFKSVIIFKNLKTKKQFTM